MKILATDFDGTLCTSAWPDIGQPRQLVINYVLKRQAEGWAVILWTNRNGELLQKAVDWCAEKGLYFDAINENMPESIQRFGTDCRKVYADEYLDDRNVHPDSAEKAMRFARSVRRGQK